MTLVGMLANPAFSQTEAPEVDWELLEQYCNECHNFDDQAGGVAFDILPHDNMLDDAGIWEMAIRKIRTGFMPPAGKPRPPLQEFANFTRQLGQRLDSERGENPNPGSEGMGRLNRAEYSNAIRDLLAYDASDVILILPPDIAEDGFDNLAEVLSVSPTLIDAYVSAAMRISRQAVGDRSMVPTQVSYDAPGGPQTRHREGLPLGTRGGMLLTHNFPLDAIYEIRVSTPGAGGVFNNQDFCPGPTVTVMLDGEILEVDDAASFQLSIPAGPHTLGAALVDNRRCEGVNEFYDVYSIGGRVQGLEIHGPFDVVGPGDTPSRRAIFSCYPRTLDEQTPCARELLSGLASGAYRRPVEATEPEVDTLMQFYRKGRDEGGFEMGVQYALARLLIDPQFLYQAELEPEGLGPGEVYGISDLELASRLSFFLWSSIPDSELINLAAAGELNKPEILEGQVERMLADEKALALVENFAGQWLQLRELEAALPQDPAFNDSLRESFRRETELLFTDLIREDLSILHLLNADYTWLNAELAGHYGIDGVRGDYMRRVTLPEQSPRRGLLGHGSILTATSVANRTSPVIRGQWIVENILGAPVPVPPPGVETDLSQETVPAGRVANTLRQRMELHRADPVCASCHQLMDPIGFALENFDLVGRWRESDGGDPINTRTTLVDGTEISTPGDMRRALLAREDALAASFTERLMTYALGRELEAYDMPAVRNVTETASAEAYRFSEIILGIVNSLPFQKKAATGDETLAVAEHGNR